MHTARRLIVAFLALSPLAAAQAQIAPASIGLRYSEQVSNGPAGACGCFTLRGTALDASWNVGYSTPVLRLSAAFDAALENTTNENGVGYGLTLSTFTAGPRISMHAHKLHPFAQALFGLAHGSGTQFPQSSGLMAHSANSFAFDLGVGSDYALTGRLSLRLPQLDYLHTAFPNNASNWQNNLRVAAGLTLRFPR